jgi:hypothetical protein
MEFSAALGKPKKLGHFSLTFLKGGSWRQVLMDVPPQNYCPTALPIMKFFYGVFFLSGRNHQLVVCDSTS